MGGSSKHLDFKRSVDDSLKESEGPSMEFDMKLAIGKADRSKS